MLEQQIHDLERAILEFAKATHFSGELKDEILPSANSLFNRHGNIEVHPRLVYYLNILRKHIIATAAGFETRERLIPQYLPSTQKSLTGKFTFQFLSQSINQITFDEFISDTETFADYVYRLERWKQKTETSR